MCNWLHIIYYICVTSYVYMKEDFLKELSFVGFTARMKRISDSLMYDARKIYDDLDIGIEPNWHLIFLLLKKENQLTVTEISQKLGFSHPAIIKIIKKMKEKGFVESLTDPNDFRKQRLQLSEKSIKVLPHFEAEWQKIELIIEGIVDLDFLQKLAKVEDALNTKSLFEGYKENKG